MIAKFLTEYGRYAGQFAIDSPVARIAKALL
jgi:hypothetical protein